jgi:cytochrome c
MAFMPRLFLTVMVVGFAIALAKPTVGRAQSLTALQQRGEVIARGMCSGCHAVGSLGASPVSGAPAFWKLNKRTIEKLAQRLREGLLTGHEGMPIVRFNSLDAESMEAYVKMIQVP